MPDVASAFANWRTVRSPVTEAMLGPLETGCEAITLRTHLTDAQFMRLADSMRPRPDVHLFASECYDGSIRDLEFLRYFPWFDRWRWATCCPSRSRRSQRTASCGAPTSQWAA